MGVNWRGLKLAVGTGSGPWRQVHVVCTLSVSDLIVWGGVWCGWSFKPGAPLFQRVRTLRHCQLGTMGVGFQVPRRMLQSTSNTETTRPDHEVSSIQYLNSRVSVRGPWGPHGLHLNAQVQCCHLARCSPLFPVLSVLCSIIRTSISQSAIN